MEYYRTDEDVVPPDDRQRSTMGEKIRSFLIPFVTVCIIAGTAIAVIAYGRGYRLNTDGSLKPTGLIVVQSDPSGAQIIIDDKLKTATQATLTLPPGWYTVTVTKDGFQPWSKRMKIQGEVVAKAEALLLPTNPSLTALTATGVLNPTLSPDGSKLAYVIPETGSLASPSAVLATTKPGVWVLDLVDKPLGLNRDARQIAKSGNVNFSKATLAWSPDSKQILAAVTPTVNYILNADTANDIPIPVSNIKTIQTDWQTIKEQRTREQLLTVPKEFTDMASASARLLSFSPDETKILYEATAAAALPQIITPGVIGANPTEEVRTLSAGNLYVYDIKEDRNYFLTKTSSVAPEPTPRSLPPDAIAITRAIHWLPSSRHLLIVTRDKVEITDYDATNRRTAYAGPFFDAFAVPWASGGKIIILTNLNSTASAGNNLYIVNLR